MKGANDAVVRLEAVTKTYRQGTVDVHALGGIDLEIERGDFLAIAGPSGSGKSTLLNLNGGLAERTAGTISIGGRDLSNL